MLDIFSSEKRVQRKIADETRQRKIVDCIQLYSISKRITPQDLKDKKIRTEYKKSGYVFVSPKNTITGQQDKEFISDYEIVKAYEAIAINGAPNLEAKTYTVNIGGIEQIVDKEKIDMFRALYDKSQAEDTRRTVRLWSNE